MTQEQLDSGTSRWMIQSLGRLTATLALVIGIGIMIGGRARFSGQAYETALAYPGAPWSWGVVAASLGCWGILASLRGLPRHVSFALMGLGAWAFFFAISFLESAFTNPNVGLTGPIIYGYLTLTSIFLAVAHWNSRRAVPN